MVSTTDYDRFQLESCGSITTPSDMAYPDRLRAIYRSVRTLIEKHHPDTVAVEELFFSKNVKTAFAVGQARGVILLAIAEADATCAEYNPNEVKKSLTGDGGADKKAIQKTVQQELGLAEPPRPDDAADGLALAICHFLKERLRSRGF